MLKFEDPVKMVGNFVEYFIITELYIDIFYHAISALYPQIKN